jgi:hypothetical protein
LRAENSPESSFYNLWECVKLADLVGLQTANELVLSFLNYSHYCRGPVF